MPDELKTLLATLWGECRSEPYVGQIAVACVIRNRVLDPRWPNTFDGVCKQRLQFSCWNDGSIPIPKVDSAQYNQLYSITSGILNGAIPDITGGATHYINAYATPAEPSWAQDRKTYTLWPSPLTGVHTFMKL